MTIADYLAEQDNSASNNHRIQVASPSTGNSIGTSLISSSENSSLHSVVVTPGPEEGSISWSPAEIEKFCFPTDLDLVRELRGHHSIPVPSDDDDDDEFSVENLQAISRKALPDLMELTVSRTGRDLQRWTSVNGSETPNCRLTTGCIPILRDGRILLVSSSKSPDVFVLPKGGWEQDESLPFSALRETLEEAGVTGFLGPPLAKLTFETKKAAKRRLSKERGDKIKNGCNQNESLTSESSEATPANTKTGSHHHTHNRMTLFPLYVQSVYDQWPEQKRLRRVVTLEEAAVLLRHRPEFAKMLQALTERNLHRLSGTDTDEEG